eukprot:Phypoly_transcript_04796.p1 GENE.Phypoly_transcript_04796~~Phypoly_transcript_04796.p1  ORF type:complete len:601 (+),score=111.18 Phypoly_transcript_04796:104-1804(+)
MEDLGDFSHPGTSSPVEDDILRYLLSDSPASEDSTPDNTPPRMFEDSTPDVSPAHWSQDLATPPTVPQLSELSLDLNPEMLLYGSNLNSDFNFMSSSLSGAPLTPPKDITQPIVPTHIVPIVQPPSQAVPLVQPPHVEVPIVVQPPPKKNRVSGKKRSRVEVPSVPSPQEQVALPRDTLLNITSQSMERYVETLQTTRHLSTDDQKELKRQKRLIKNRESAQLSRERKRAYIDQLEARIAQLVADNGQLKNDNNTLREALARYQSTDPTIKSEPLSPSSPPHSPASQLQIKMGKYLSVGRSTTAATAGVCLLVVLFSFGLFMNVNKPSNVLMPRLPASQAVPAIMFENSVIAPVELGIHRGLLEAGPLPEVKDEENDTESFDQVKFTKALPFDTPAAPAQASHAHAAPRQVIRLAGHSSTPPSPPNTKNQQKIEINRAGVFTVSYSPDPATFINNNGEHSHAQGSNSTFMLFLDPRPDLEDDTENENTSAPVSATHETQLQVATPSLAKKTENFPPMIISLAFPEDFANGSNPLLLPEGLNPENSLMEITCQVVDISITTSEHPRN